MIQVESALVHKTPQFPAYLTCSPRKDWPSSTPRALLHTDPQAHSCASLCLSRLNHGLQFGLKFLDQGNRLTVPGKLLADRLKAPFHPA